MSKLFKIVLFVSCAMFASVTFADIYQEQASKAIANGAKQFLLSQYKKFPINIEENTLLTDISANKQYVVYDYDVLMPSDNFTIEILSDNLKTSLKRKICKTKSLCLFLKSMIYAFYSAINF